MCRNLGDADRFSACYGQYKPRPGVVETGSTTSDPNNGVRRDLRMFSCSEYVTLVLPPRQTPAIYGRLLDVNAVSLWPEVDLGCRGARMSMQLAP